jgi:3-dehydrotetronate 4-kinase
MRPYLGCIADDFTGGTDLASMLACHGLKTIQTIGVPAEPLEQDVTAIVIALKSRTTRPEVAVQESLDALEYLRAVGCRQIYFKYCSTFDSTDEGNIGPVTDALMSALRTDFTIACPAFPENKRTVYNGYLFVSDVLLSESGMQNHPLTPMRDSNLVRVLQRQTGSKVGLVKSEVVSGGEDATLNRFQALQASGTRIAIVDALNVRNLIAIGQACFGMPLVTAGSGVAMGIATDLIRRGVVAATVTASAIPVIAGQQAIFAGSCSLATRRQVASALHRGVPGFVIDPLQLTSGEPVIESAVEWARPLLRHGPILIYSTDEQQQVRKIQGALGVEKAGKIIEDTLAAIARLLVAEGITQLIVAGGETSGAVVKALEITQLLMGPSIAPGVPWTLGLGKHPVNIALKSGNFGEDDFFTTSWAKLHAR